VIESGRDGENLGLVQSLDWTTELTQTAKYNSFSAEQKLNVLIPWLTLLPTAPGREVSRGQWSRAYLISINKHSTATCLRNAPSAVYASTKPAFNKG